MFVKPAAGLLIRDPDRRDRIPPEGREVPETAYWRRRLAEKSVVRIAAPLPISERQDPPIVLPPPRINATEQE